MKHPLMPDYIYEKFDDVTVDFLKSKGIKAVVLDVDNTLEPYENPTPSPKVAEWFSALREANISAAIVSNNDAARIDLFNKDLGLPAFSKAKKPFKKNILKAMEILGTDSSNTIFMGDQIFTDVWAAHNAKIPAILVPPIKDKRDLLTRFKRLLEVPIMKKYIRRHKSNDRNEK